MKSHENKYLLRAYTSPFNSVCAKYVDSIWELGMSYQDSITIQFQTNQLQYPDFIRDQHFPYLFPSKFHIGDK